MTKRRNKRDTRERMINATMLIGVLLWAATVFLRETSLIHVPIIRSLLGVAPNFGAVWGAFGLTYTTVFPVILKRKFDFRYSVPLLVLIVSLLLVSEIIHDVFLNSPFDGWDMVTSLVAAALLWMGLSLTRPAA